MKREICALLLLAALIAASVWNIRRADGLVADVREHVALSEKALRAGDADYAAQQLTAAYRVWNAAKNYTRIFLRHAELDSASDIFFEAKEQLNAGEFRAIPAVYDKLRYHLDCISSMEHVSAGSIF